MVFVTWKQRLYAFLLRRILGPYLSPTSLQQLHESIDVSLNEGRFTLNDIDLNYSFLTRLLHQKLPGSELGLYTARCRKLQIFLCLQEEEEGKSSLAWRAMNIGEAHGISLVAHIEVEGLELYLEPLKEPLLDEHPCPSPTDSQRKDPGNMASSSSRISSYVEAALASLQLTLKLGDTRIRICNSFRDGLQNWIEFGLGSANYHDVDLRTDMAADSPPDSKSKIALHKVIDFVGLTLKTGETCAKEDSEPVNESCIIAKTDGNGQIQLRAIEFLDAVGDGSRIEQDVEIKLNQLFNISVGDVSLRTILVVLNDLTFQSQTAVLPEESKVSHQSAVPTIEEPRYNNDDEEDLSTIQGIMKQFEEAKQLAETHEVRGGMLVPSTDDGSVSFDTFFDANDQSFYHYASVLKESTTIADGLDHVHTEIKFHLRELQLKVAFPTSSHTPSLDSETSRLAPPAEYALVTFNDINTTSSLSRKRLELSFSVSHALVEASRVGGAPAFRSEICTLLSFAESPFDESNATDIVSSAPCIVVDFKRERKVKSIAEISVELRIQPLETYFYLSTFSKVSQLLHVVREPGRICLEPGANDPSTRADIADDQGTQIEFTVVCPSWTVLVPILENGHADVDLEPAMNELFRRCGYRLSNAPFAGDAHIGFAVDDLVISNLEQPSLGTEAPVDDDSPEQGQLVSCQRGVAFVTFPHKDSFGRVLHSDRVDILGLSGQAPISIRRIMSGQVEEEKSAGDQIFPMVPSISSFKARQEDDEDEDLDPLQLGGTTENGGFSSVLKPPDPQPAMLRATRDCHEAMEVNIPSVSLDLTRTELDALATVFNAAFASRQERKQTSTNAKLQTDVSQPTKSRALLLAVEQIHVNVHQSLEPSVTEELDQLVTFSFVGDGWKVFALMLEPSQKCYRLLAQGLDCYYVEGLASLNVDKIHDPAPVCIESCCDRIQQRMLRNLYTVAKPILYVSKLFQPLSPDCPAVLLDILQLAGDAERSLHFSLYNMTYRYDVESTWIDRLSSFLRPADATEASTDPVGQNEFLTKLFVTLADCNVDYTSPPSFAEPSRTIFRFSDVRFSSNIVSPAGQVQAYRLSVGDVSIQLCNRRASYAYENMRLSRSSMLLHEVDLTDETLDSGAFRGIASSMRGMNLATILTLDAMSASILVRKNATDHDKDPSLFTTLAFGSLCLYGCKDSFQCFTETLTELNIRLTALSEDSLNEMRSVQGSKRSESGSRSSSEDNFFDSRSVDQDNASPPAQTETEAGEKDLLATPHASPRKASEEFSLDGYDWTTVDNDWTRDSGMAPGEEQAAKWYASKKGELIAAEPLATLSNQYGTALSESFPAEQAPSTTLKINPHHITVHPVSDPLAHGDMDSARHAGLDYAPPVKCRILVRDLKVRCRFFDGYDWPRYVKKRTHPPARKYTFIIEETLDVPPESIEDDKQPEECENKEGIGRKASLMGTLLAGDEASTNGQQTFREIPLPEERSEQIRSLTEERRLARRMNRFLQVSFTGLRARMDMFEESADHRLSSCLELKMADLFLAETISNEKPVKLLGEWLNDVEHPRDSADGLLMMKMVTWRPAERVTEELEIASDESHAVLHILPLRCHIYQRALRFGRAFFTNPQEEKKPERAEWTVGLKEIPPRLFQKFKVKSCKMKVDYNPETVNVSALRDGSVVELINLSPLNDMVITLRPVEMENKIGFGPVLGELVSSWIRDICDSQLYKFVINSSPFQPITGIGDGVVDMVVLPWDAIKNGEDVGRALKSGVSSFASCFAYETLNATAKLTNYAAKKLLLSSRSSTSGLPPRPEGMPRGVVDAAGHALESIAVGVEEANYKVVIIPYREFQSKGATSAAKSVMKGLPVAILAPVGGASEALSYTLLGVRNQVRPDIRKEEEASQRGLQYGDF